MIYHVKSSRVICILKNKMLLHKTSGYNLCHVKLSKKVHYAYKTMWI